MAFFIYYLGSDLSGKNGSATLVSNEVIMNKPFPTKQEFIAEKAKFAQVMRDIMSQNYTINNTKIDEVVARSHYGIENGYQALVDHWKKTSLDDVVLPADAKEQVFLFIDECGELWPYHGKVTLEPMHISLSDGCIAGYSQEYLDSDSFGDAVNNEQIKIYRKFYEAEWVAVEIENIRSGVTDWASYVHSESELRDYGLLPEKYSIGHEVYAGGCGRVVVCLQKKGEHHEK